MNTNILTWLHPRKTVSISKDFPKYSEHFLKIDRFHLSKGFSNQKVPPFKFLESALNIS